MSTHAPYDFEAAITKCRAAMKKTDLTTLSTVALARSVADHVRQEFPTPEQQENAARSLILATGCVGGQLEAMPSFTPHAQKFLAVTMLNVQACAGVMILDQLEIEQLEANLKATP